MSKKIHVLVIALFILPAIPRATYALPAFPGAQGWGSDTIGGRSASAKLCKVNSLLDNTIGSCSGNICSGTLRYCINQHTLTGPKFVIFTVGGTINLGSEITVREPYMTIAGQTAPGGGILIRGPNQQTEDGFPSIQTATHDLIIRGLRFRDTGNSGISILGDRNNYGTGYNIIVDHNSMSWHFDSMAEAWGDVNHITYSYNIFSEATPSPEAGGREGMLLGSMQGCYVWTQDLSIHHNLFAHNSARNPLIKHDTGRNEITNNVIYNWDYAGIDTYASSYIAKNVLIAGNNTSYSPRGIRVGPGGECPSMLKSGTVMVTHNISPSRPTDTGDDWLAVDGGTNQYRTNSPPFTLWGMTEDDVSIVKAKVLAAAGATVPYRDSVDIRIINDVINGTGHFINDPSDVGGWPTIASGLYPTDTDGDGMPDSWETARGLNPNDPSDWNKDRNGDGYLNIEEYINDFFVSTLIPRSSLTPNAPIIIGIN